MIINNLVGQKVTLPIVIMENVIVAKFFGGRL